MAGLLILTGSTATGGWSADDWIALAGMLQIGVLTAAAVFAWRQVREARKARGAQTRPYVIVYAEPTSLSRQMIELIIENVGQTPAQDVVIRFSPALVSTLDRPDFSTGDWVALKEGIPFLAPRQRMVHVFDTLIGRYGPDGSSLPRHYDVTVRYRGGLDDGLHEETYKLDLGVWFGSASTTEYTVHHVAQQLEAIARTIKGWTEGSGVRVYGMDLEKYHEEVRAWMNERRAAQSPPPLQSSTDPDEGPPDPPGSP